MSIGYALRSQLSDSGLLVQTATFFCLNIKYRAIVPLLFICILSVGCAEKRTYSQTLERKALMSLIFGADYESEPKALDFSNLDNPQFKNKSNIKTTISPEYVVKVDEQNAVLLTQVNPYDSDCHMCQVVHGAYQFQRDKKGWYLHTRQDAIVMTGENGLSGDTSVHKLSDGRFALAIDSGYCGQGLCTRALTLVHLSSSGASLMLDHLPIGHDNDGAWGGCSAIDDIEDKTYIENEKGEIRECRQIVGKWRLDKNQLLVDFSGRETNDRPIGWRKIHTRIKQRVVYSLASDKAERIAGVNPLSKQ